MAVKKDGTLWAWGNAGGDGQLGNGANNKSIVPVQVLGENGEGFFQLFDSATPAPDNRDVTISANASIPTPTYTVTIPEKIEVGSIVQKLVTDPDAIKTTEFTVSASNVNHLFGDKVDVAISTTSGNFELASGNNTIPYSVKNAPSGADLTSGDTFAEFSDNGEQTGYITIDQSTITQRGDYSNTLTFTIRVLSNN